MVSKPQISFEIKARDVAGVDTIANENMPVPDSLRGDFNYNGKLDLGDSIGILQTVTGIRD